MQGDLEKELTCSVSRVLFSRWCCAGEGGDMLSMSRKARIAAKKKERCAPGELERTARARVKCIC